jgi:aminoglycoside phosphotransferase family enzyme
MPPARGQWVSSDNELFMERMIPVRIACAKEQIDRIADMTAAFYEQKAVMFYRISNEVYIKNYEGEYGHSEVSS